MPTEERTSRRRARGDAVSGQLIGDMASSVRAAVQAMKTTAFQNAEMGLPRLAEGPRFQ